MKKKVIVSQAVSHLSFVQLIKLFWVWFTAQSVVLFFGRMFFPGSIVLGTNLISPLMAILYSMFVLSLFSVGTIPLVEVFQDMKKKKLSTTEWMLLYIVVNTIGLLIISRFAVSLGLGLSSWMVAVVLGIVISVVQGFFAMRMGAE